VNALVRRWLPGDRVTRMAFMDDGTWRREGDKCLPRSPLRRGIVTHRSTERTDEVWVRFDDGEARRYLDHGLDADTSNAEGQGCRASRHTLDPLVGSLNGGDK